MLLETLLNALDVAEGRNISVICGGRYTLGALEVLGRPVLNVVTGEKMLIVWRDNQLTIDRVPQ